MNIFKNFLVYLFVCAAIGAFYALLPTLSLAAENNTPKVGVIIPLSGPMADWGRSIQIGIEFAAKKDSSSVQYVFEDEGACDSQKALTAAQKLMNVDKVALLMTGCLNGTRAILPVARKLDVLVVSLGLVNDELMTQNKDWLITPSASITAEADGISKLLKADRKKKLALIRVEDNFTEELLRGLKNYATRDGWELVADERLTFDTTDFRSSLLKISRVGADAVLLYTSTEQVVYATKQIKQMKMNSLGIYGGYVIEADPPPSDDMASLNGVRYAAAVTPVNDELTRYLAASGSKETFQTRVAADSVHDVSKAFTDCVNNPTRVSCFIHAMRTRTVETPAFSGGFFYDQNGLATRTVKSKVVRNGQYQWVE